MDAIPVPFKVMCTAALQAAGKSATLTQGDALGCSRTAFQAEPDTRNSRFPLIGTAII